jgi:hypothetical protein
MKNKLGNWIPVAFCAILSAICVATFIGHPTAWVIPFLCFLPMCFFFMASVTSKLQKEIRDLREHVAKLEGARVD